MKRHIAVIIDLEWPLKYHHEMFAGIQRYVEKQGWTSMAWPFLPEDENLGDTYDGIVGRITPEVALLAEQAQLPIVNVWSFSPVPNLCTVQADLRATGKLAADHLLTRGFKRFGFLGYRGSSGSDERREGFQSPLKAAGHPCDEVMLVSPDHATKSSSWAQFRKETQQWISRWNTPIGIYVGADILARYLINEVINAGLRIPEDVALVGTGNEPITCRKAQPTLSSIEVGYDRVGYAAAERLDQLIQGLPQPSLPLLIPPVGLIARKSTDCFAVDDPIVGQALEYISAHYHQPIKVKDVVANVPSSERSLERRFQQVRGCTMAEEIAQRRLDRVKLLLAESDTPIKEIASSCGYADAAQLCTTFRKAEGTTPGKYRKTRSSKGI